MAEVVEGHGRQCLLEEAKGWGFKRPTGGGLVVVKQTLKFSPG